MASFKVPSVALLHPCSVQPQIKMDPQTEVSNAMSNISITSDRTAKKVSMSDPMTGVKRHHDGAAKEKEVNASPFMPMFEAFRDELDQHHDRRERIIKASRDITAASKKM